MSDKIRTDRRRMLLAQPRWLPRRGRRARRPTAAGTNAPGRRPQAEHPGDLGDDDVGIANVSVYSFGLMGYKTPNIDRISREVGDDRNEFLPGDRLASTERPDGVGAGGG